MKNIIEISFEDMQKINKAQLDHIKNKCERWDRNRTKSGLNALTLKERCSCIEITQSAMHEEIKSVKFVNRVLWAGLVIISITTLICTIFQINMIH